MDLLAALFDPLCHRDPARSLAVAGETSLVCARCTGIYAGLAVSAILFALSRHPRRGRAAFLIHALLLAQLGVAGLLGVPTDPWARAGSGALFGLGVGWFLALVAPGARASRGTAGYALCAASALLAIRMLAATAIGPSVLAVVTVAGAVWLAILGILVLALAARESLPLRRWTRRSPGTPTASASNAPPAASAAGRTTATRTSS